MSLMMTGTLQGRHPSHSGPARTRTWDLRIMSVRFAGVFGSGTASWAQLDGVRFAELGTWFGTRFALPTAVGGDISPTAVRPVR